MAISASTGVADDPDPPSISHFPPRLVPATQMARILGISGKGLWTHSAPRGPIPVIRIGRSVRYCPSDVLVAVKQMQAVAEELDVGASAPPRE